MFLPVNRSHKNVSKFICLHSKGTDFDQKILQGIMVTLD